MVQFARRLQFAQDGTGFRPNYRPQAERLEATEGAECSLQGGVSPFIEAGVPQDDEGHTDLLQVGDQMGQFLFLVHSVQAEDEGTLAVQGETAIGEHDTAVAPEDGITGRGQVPGEAHQQGSFALAGQSEEDAKPLWGEVGTGGKFPEGPVQGAFGVISPRDVGPIGTGAVVKVGWGPGGLGPAERLVQQVEGESASPGERDDIAIAGDDEHLSCVAADGYGSLTAGQSKRGVREHNILLN